MALRDELTQAGRDAQALLSDLYQAAEAVRGFNSDELMSMALNQPFTDLLPCLDS